jgi:hypothetical protein
LWDPGSEIRNKPIPDPGVKKTLDPGSGTLIAGMDNTSPGLLGDKGPELVQVDGGAAVVGNVGVHVEVPHAHLSEVPGVVLIEVDPERINLI